MKIFRTIPNQITLSRILFVPLLMFLILFESDVTRILAMVLFFLAAVSDAVDGYIARSPVSYTHLTLPTN